MDTRIHSHQIVSNRIEPDRYPEQPRHPAKTGTHHRAPKQRHRYIRRGLLSVLVAGALVTSCATTHRSVSSSPMEQEAASLEGAQADRSASEASALTVADVPRSLPQLVKRAELVIEVEAIDEVIEQVGAIARESGGDLLTLQIRTPINNSVPHIAYLEIRVPQSRLELALDQLSELGRLERQSLTAEDVSAQLVDYEARLRNLRKAEEAVLDIMDRSGEISDVLQVAQELRNIRQSIEQIDGELASLRNRVNYSTITLTLSAEIASTPSQTSVMTQLQGSWTGATRSIADLTVSLMQLGIWLLVYSPYWLVLGGLIYGGYRFVKRDRPSVS